MISARIPAELEARLERLCKRAKRPKAFFVREAIRDKVEELEDIQDALDQIENPGKLHSLQEVKRGLGL